MVNDSNTDQPGQDEQGKRRNWWIPGIILGLPVLLLLYFTAIDDGGGDANQQLASDVGAAYSETYGGTDGGLDLRFTDSNGAANVTVVSTFQDTPQGREAAMGVCRSVASLRDQVSGDWRRVYVTAGEGGKFLAECQPAR